MVGEMTAVLQEYVVAPLAVKIVVTPGQIVGLFTVIVGIALTVIVATAVFVQPTTDVPVTVYVVVTLGEKEVLFKIPPLHV